MVAQAQFSNAGVMVEPGDIEVVSLSLANIGNQTETYTLVPSGLLAGWVRIVPPTVTLFGGTGEDIEVTIRPPKLPTTPAGPAPLTIRIIPLDDPDDVIIAETTVIIGAFDDRSIRVLQPVVRSRRRGLYEFLVENQGNTQSNVRLHLIDTSRRLDGDFDPPAVAVEPGGTSLVRLQMKALRRTWGTGPRTIPFSIEADQQGYATAAANATFVQSPMLPERLGRKFVGLVVAAGALAGLWFGLLRPATERAARDAVRDIPSALVVVSSPTTTSLPAASTVPGDTTSVTIPTVATTAPPSAATQASAQASGPEGEAGAFFSSRLALETEPQQTSEQPFVVPDGKELRITDVVIQNVHLDSGFATLLKNGDPLVPWDLGAMFEANIPLQFVSPLVFEAGSSLVLRVECTAPGQPGTCSEGLLFSGRLVDV